MTTRCKFKVSKIERTLGYLAVRGPDGKPMVDEQGRMVHTTQELNTILMEPVYHNNDPNHENAKFWAASPTGGFALGTVNAEAIKGFPLGAEVYIDLTVVPTANDA